MAISVSVVGKFGARDSRELLIACPSTVPIGALLVAVISVRTLNTWNGTHEIQTPDGWALEDKQTNYSSPSITLDYKELWAFSKVKAVGDESWVFRSMTQTPTRAALLLAITGFATADGLIEVQKTGSGSNTTAHTFTALTIATIGNVFLALTTQSQTEISVAPVGFDCLGTHRKGGDGGRVYEADVSAWAKVMAATGSTGSVGYTNGVSDDYCTVSLEVAIGASAKTVSGVTFGGYEVPRMYGTPRIVNAVGVEADALALALSNEQNQPLLLATLSPLLSDAPGAAASEEKLSSGYYSRHYHPAIAKVPTIERKISIDEKIGGRAAQTLGSLVVNNERAKSFGVE